MFTLDQVVPWGRSFDEYRRMFALTDADLHSRILGCGDGPASFNTEATRGGTDVVSVDPLYRYDVSQIRERIAAICDQVLEQTRQNAGEFVWDTIASVEQLGTLRMAAMDAFLEDYDAGRKQGRYVEAELPALPFPDLSFDLAVCSHFLFLYTTQLTEAFHQAAVIELCRVAREVRIFPLLALAGGLSPYVELVADSMRCRGYAVSIEVVAYEFRRGGNQMMRLRSIV
jgi:hypothetical protein